MRKKLLSQTWRPPLVCPVALTIDEILMEKPLPPTRVACMGTIASLDSFLHLFSLCSEATLALQGNFLGDICPGDPTDYLSSNCKRSIKPAGPSSETVEKSSQIVNLLVRLTDYLNIREQTFWHHSCPVLSTTSCLFSSCGNCLAHQIMTKRKNP